MVNLYVKMKQRHLKEIQAIPVIFAKSEAQFAKGMKQLNLQPHETYRVRNIFQSAFCRVEDVPKYVEMEKKHNMELEKAMHDKRTGEKFVKDRYEYITAQSIMR